MGPGRRHPVARQSEADHPARHRLRPDRAVRAAARLRAHLRGNERLCEPHRRGRPQPAAHELPARGRHRRPVRRLRHRLRDCRAPSATRQPRAARSTCRPPRRCCACSRPLPVEHELLGHARSRSGSRATYTAPSNMYRTRRRQLDHAGGIVRRDLHAASATPWAGPSWPPIPASRPPRTGCATSRRSTRSSPTGARRRTLDATCLGAWPRRGAVQQGLYGRRRDGR